MFSLHFLRPSMFSVHLCFQFRFYVHLCFHFMCYVHLCFHFMLYAHPCIHFMLSIRVLPPSSMVYFHVLRTVHIQLCILKFYVHIQRSVLCADSFTYFDVLRPFSMVCIHVLRTCILKYVFLCFTYIFNGVFSCFVSSFNIVFSMFYVPLQCCIIKFNKILSIFRIRLRFHVVPPACPGYLFGGGIRPTPRSLASVVHTFEAVAGSWGSVSAPVVSRVMGGAPERNKNSNKYRWNYIWGRVFVNVVSLKYIGMTYIKFNVG